MPTSWLTKMKDESSEDTTRNLHSPNMPNPLYPQCSSAPTLTTNSTPSCAQSPKNNLMNSMYSPRKDKRRLGGLIPLPNQSFSRLSEVEYSPKRIPDIPSFTTGCPSKNWKITHSDRLNALIDECERIVDGRKVFKCKFCGKMYDIKSSMRYHMKIIHLQLHLRTSEMQCRICGKQFTCISAVNRHQLKCSANSSSNFTSTNPIQSSCGSSFLGKPRQSSLPTFASQSPSAFMNLNSTPSLRWSGLPPPPPTNNGRQSNQSINSQIPFTFSPTSDTTAYISSSVTTAFQSQSTRSGFDLEGSRFQSGGGGEIPSHQLGSSSLVHSVHNLVEGIPPLAFNEVFLASLSRSNGVNTNERKAPLFDDLPPPNFMNTASTRNFLIPSPSKRMRKLENPTFIEGRINDNLYEKLFPTSNNESVTTTGTSNSTGTAIDLSLNASC